MPGPIKDMDPVFLRKGILNRHLHAKIVPGQTCHPEDTENGAVGLKVFSGSGAHCEATSARRGVCFVFSRVHLVVKDFLQCFHRDT